MAKSSYEGEVNQFEKSKKTKMIIVIIESRLIEWKRREPVHIIYKLRSESSKILKIANTDSSGYLSSENGLRIELSAGTARKIKIN